MKVAYTSLGDKPMKNAEKLKNGMNFLRVYRRQELEGLSTAIDRDLKHLVTSGEVRKLAGGLYYRPRMNAFGATPPDDHEVVRAFLKTDDFLLTSDNHFNQLGLGLTQVYNGYRVYNHKRSGTFSLNGKRFAFRQVPSYPLALSKEYLLVDLFNNLNRLPDRTDRVIQNLHSHMDRFSRETLDDFLRQYGRPRAREALRRAYA